MTSQSVSLLVPSTSWLIVVVMRDACSVQSLVFPNCMRIFVPRSGASTVVLLQYQIVGMSHRHVSVPGITVKDFSSQIALSKRWSALREFKSR